MAFARPRDHARKQINGQQQNRSARDRLAGGRTSELVPVDTNDGPCATAQQVRVRKDHLCTHNSIDGLFLDIFVLSFILSIFTVFHKECRRQTFAEMFRGVGMHAQPQTA